MKKEELKKELKKELVKEFKEILKGTRKTNRGYKLTFRIERVAKSGMSRCLSVYASKGEYKRNITRLVSQILDETYTKDGFMRVYGCGMDMLFDTCYNLNAEIKSIDKYKGTKKDNYNYIVDTSYNLI